MEISRSDYETLPIVECPGQADGFGCEDCGYFQDTDAPFCAREWLVNHGVPCSSCGYYFVPDKEKYDEWGNSGRPFEPTDWVCGFCNKIEPVGDPLPL